jgi:hypothetical protein
MRISNFQAARRAKIESLPEPASMYPVTLVYCFEGELVEKLITKAKEAQFTPEAYVADVLRSGLGLESQLNAEEGFSINFPTEGESFAGTMRLIFNRTNYAGKEFLTEADRAAAGNNSSVGIVNDLLAQAVGLQELPERQAEVLDFPSRS